MTSTPTGPRDHHEARKNGGEYGRRQFLHLVAGGALAAGISATPSCAGKPSEAPASDALTSDALGVGNGGSTGGSAAGGEGVLNSDGPSSPRPRALSINADRTLVVVELRGGNDGLDTLVPYADPAYAALRPRIAVPLEDVLPIDDEVGFNPALARLHDRTVASIEGVGLGTPSFSHSDCVRRWSRGDTLAGDRFHTGFLGRLCDQLDIGAPATGVSLAVEPTTALFADKARTALLPDLGRRGWFNDREDPWNAALIAGLRTMATSASPAGSPAANPLLPRSSNAIGDLLTFADVMRELPDASEGYERGELSQGLEVASQLIRSELGVRVIHVPLGGFDTHGQHRWRHDKLLEEVDVAVDTFLTDMEEHGRADSVLVATVSEFGRRPAENRGGTDHGSASVALMAGAVNAGRYGVAPSLTKLVDENLRVEVNLADYYATLAESWFGIPASEVLTSGATPIEGIIAS